MFQDNRILCGLPEEFLMRFVNIYKDIYIFTIETCQT